MKLAEKVSAYLFLLLLAVALLLATPASEVTPPAESSNVVAVTVRTPAR